MLCELQHCNYKHVIGQVPLIHRVKAVENHEQITVIGEVNVRFATLRGVLATVYVWCPVGEF